MDCTWDIFVYIIGFLYPIHDQFASGLFYQKGMSGLDVLGFFTPYLLQPIPGLLYFASLKFIQYVLLILLDMEDNTRRAA